MSVVGDEAAARMAYWCATDEKGGVGYDQDTREEIRDLSYVSTPRLTGAVDSDCSAMVAAACNLGGGCRARGRGGRRPASAARVHVDGVDALRTGGAGVA